MVESEEVVAIAATQPTELILVDVPMQWQPVGVWAR
jgi:hypothetical protein